MTKVGGVPTRMSTMDDPEMVKQYPEFITLQPAARVLEPRLAPDHRRVGRDQHPGAGRGRVRGADRQEDAEDALNGMVPKVTDIMKRGGYLKA